MGGERRNVLTAGPAGSAAECGRWLNGVLPVGDLIYGLVHQEAGCNYARGQTHKSMGIVVSRDEGLTWTDLGTIISGTDVPQRGTGTGEGDCTMVDGEDGYLYAYCLRLSDWKTIAARAPLSDLGPGGWHKFRDGRWDEPALGGDATAIGFQGVASGYLKDIGRIALVVADPWFKGVRLSLSADKAHFTDLKEPLLPLDAVEWQRPAPSDLVAYLSLLDPAGGSNGVGNDFLLAMVYVSGLTNPTSFTNVGLITGLGMTVALAVACFVVPLYGMHARIATEKARRLEEANRRLDRLLAELDRRTDLMDLAEADAFNKQLASVTTQRQVVSAVPTWPWQAETLRWFVTAIVLPVALWLIYRFLERQLA